MAESGNDIVEFTDDGAKRWAARNSKAYQKFLKRQKQAPPAEPPAAQQVPPADTSATQATDQVPAPAAPAPQAQAGGKPKA